MRIFFFIATVFLFACSTKRHSEEGVLGVLGSKYSEPERNSISGVVFVDNYDGDTFTVNIAGIPPVFGAQISVRVRGIDAPEIRGKGLCEKERAIESRDLLRSKLLQANLIKLENVARDKYFRLLADVSFDGADLADALKERKLAVPYDGGTKTLYDWCR
jgi:micrococcal nuclease